jgi:predicted transcriptional regulator
MTTTEIFDFKKALYIRNMTATDFAKKINTNSGNLSHVLHGGIRVDRIEKAIKTFIQENRQNIESDEKILEKKA